jgi:hypothetical protein
LTFQKGQQSLNIVNAISPGRFRKFENLRARLLGIKMLVNHASHQQRRIQLTGVVVCQPCETGQQIAFADLFW